MKRRNFLIGGIAAGAAVRSWPFRVYSFPSQIITVDYLAEKQKYINLARIYLDEQAAKYGPYRWAVDYAAEKEKYRRQARAYTDVQDALLGGE